MDLDLDILAGSRFFFAWFCVVSSVRSRFFFAKCHIRIRFQSTLYSFKQSSGSGSGYFGRIQFFYLLVTGFLSDFRRSDPDLDSQHLYFLSNQEFLNHFTNLPIFLILLTVRKIIVKCI